MERTTNRGRPKGSRGGRGKGKRGRKPRVVVSDTEESNEVETNLQEPEAMAIEPEIDNTTEAPAPEAVADTPLEVKEVNSSLVCYSVAFFTQKSHISRLLTCHNSSLKRHHSRQCNETFRK